MNRQTNRATERMTKKEISKKLADFSERLLKAPTAFETVATLQEMRALNQHEVDYWAIQVAEADPTDNESYESLINEAAVHVSGLNDTIAEINKNICIYHAQAVLIERARINSRLIKEPVILPLP
jgi:hypothetical protein